MRTTTILTVPLLAFAVALGSCSGDSGAPLAPIVESEPAVPVSMMFAPSTLRLREGDNGMIAASVHDARGALLSGLAISWSSSDPAVAAVDANGRVTAVHMGDAEITASIGTISATGSVRVDPAPHELIYVSGSGQEGSVMAVLPDSLAVRLVDRFGEPIVGVAVTFESTAGACMDMPASVVTDADGYARAAWKLGHDAGQHAALAWAGALEGTVAFAALAHPGEPSSLEATPDTIRLSALGTTAQLEAVVRDEGRNALVSEITWSSVNPAVATISSTGQVEAISAGLALILAQSGDLSASVTVVVARQLAALVISPSSPELRTGEVLKLTVTAFDATGVEIERAGFHWKSSNNAVASVSEAGELTAKAAGSVVIRVGLDGVSDTVTVVVRP
jgi:trimeric autotransporter adhesin